MKKLGIVTAPIYLEHKPGPFHPESPKRLEALYHMLELDSLRTLFELVHPREAHRDEIERIHTSSYFDLVASTARRPSTFLDADTQTSEKSFEAALSAAGGILTGIDELFSEKYSSILALVRPPGHHAEQDRGMGFCLFNNIAIGALYAIEKYSVERVLIVDWDLHHGNGTQHSFYNDERVLYFSTHQYPYYPGTGDFSEVGSGKGKGFTINVPLSIGNGDIDYYTIFKNLLEPISNMYRPQLVLVSAGFDIYYKDPLGGMEVTKDGFAGLTHIVESIADRHAGSKLLMTLEGGYDLDGLREGVAAVIEQLVNKSEIFKDLTVKNRDRQYRRSEMTIEKVISIQKKFWNCF